MRVCPSLACVLLLISGVTHSTLGDDGSLRSAVDQRLKPLCGLDSVRCSDAEFLRRVSLDLAGMPPAADEARKFIGDSSTDKRQHLVDRLLASPHFARHLATVLDLILMERRPNTHVSADEWQAWLLKSVQNNKPWNVLAREILAADGDDPASRPAARFALDRNGDPHALTRDIGRIFFGRDLQCAQCHDHPLVEDYLQSDYHGLLACISPGYVLTRTEGDKQITLYAEKAGNDLSFESVFLGMARRTGPRVLNDLTIEQPFFLPGEEYEVAPAENVKPQPKYSLRAKLAGLATNGSNRAFNENIANRLWAHMFGRGLVHPPDFHHTSNPAADPELLRILGERLAAMQYDMKGFLREIALTEVYQRSFVPPSNFLSASANATSTVVELQRQQAELEERAKASGLAYAQALGAWQEAEAALLPAAKELDAARTQYAEAKKKLDELTKAIADATAQLEAKQKIAALLQQTTSAAQQVKEALPEDKELTEAAAKFAARSGQLNAEVEALAKSLEEKTTARQPLADALSSAKTAIDNALAKNTPLTAVMKQTEAEMLLRRSQAAVDATALAELDQRLAALNRLAQLPELHQRIETANVALAAREAELAAAEQQVREQLMVVTQHETAVQAATEALAAASSSLTAARSAQVQHSQAAESITVALNSANAASEKIPGDAVLTEVVSKLQARAGAAQAASGEIQQQLDNAVAAETAAAEAVAAAQKLLEASQAERIRREQDIAAANQRITAARSELDKCQAEYSAATDALTSDLTQRFTVIPLQPLTPEQLCWSVLRVTGVYDRQWQAEVAELDQAKPLSEEQKKDPVQVSLRAAELEQRTFDKLKGNVATFVSLYGAGAGQPQGDFFSTADQALFAANGGAVNGWIAPAADNVTERIIKQSDSNLAAEELYLAVLSRLPTEEEKAGVVDYLAGRATDKELAARELVWALLNSAEFRFNH